MSAEKAMTERIWNALRPFASNWSGTLSRGDLVIPQAEVPRLIREIAGAAQDVVERHAEAPELEIFQTLMTSSRASAVQDQVTALRKRFLILTR